MVPQMTWKSTVNLKPIQDLISPGDDILIGYPEGRPHAGGGINNDELARKLTYGDADTPARPVLEEGILTKKNELGQLIQEHYTKRVEGHDKRPSLKRIGAEAVSAVQEFVRSDYYKETVPNAPATIDRKSRRQKGKYLLSDKPWIDIGDLINATTYVIKELGK